MLTGGGARQAARRDACPCHRTAEGRAARVIRRRPSTVGPAQISQPVVRWPHFRHSSVRRWRSKCMTVSWPRAPHISCC